MDQGAFILHFEITLVNSLFTRVIRCSHPNFVSKDPRNKTKLPNVTFEITLVNNNNKELFTRVISKVTF